MYDPRQIQNANPELKPTLLYTPSRSAAAREFLAVCTLVEIAGQELLPSKVDSFCLGLDANGLSLLAPNFTTPFRLQDAMLKERIDGYVLLSQACGGAVAGLSILDPFAGFGIDGLTLALRGASMTLVEANPLVYLLLRDFRRRLGVSAVVIQGDGSAHLRTQPWDVIYLDPMFPARRKKALPNRALQHLRALTADSAQVVEQDLLAQARDCAPRVVLKRRPRDPTIGEVDFQVAGKSVRFDVYT